MANALLQFICVCLFFSLVSCRYDPKTYCLTDDYKIGRCLPLRKCQPYLELVPLAKPGSQYRTILRKARCGSKDKNIHMVCCPLKAESVKSTVIESRFPRLESRDLNPEDKLTSFPEPPVCGSSNATGGYRVLGGIPAYVGDYPWMAILGYRVGSATRWGCGGSLISSKHVLTVALCIHDQEYSLYVVRLGELDYDRDDEGAAPIDVLIKRMIKHEDYNPRTYRNDIGILVLSLEMTFTDLIKPICIPTRYDLLFNKFDEINLYFAIVAGWGQKELDRETSTRLLVSQLPLTHPAECARVYAGYAQSIDETVLCAGYSGGGIDACKGDSGGPLMIHEHIRGINFHSFYVIGLVSFAKSCAKPGLYGVYTRVTHYVPWLQQKLLAV